MTRATPVDASLDAVRTALAPEQVAPDVFRADCVRMGLPQVFGGQLLAQALIAAARTVPDRTAHSLHAHFLRAGDAQAPVDLEVDRLRDGRRLSVRSVRAVQHGRTVLAATVSFAVAGEGVDHQLPAPASPPPDELPTVQEFADRYGGLGESWGDLGAIECRIDPDADDHVWLRIGGALPDDPVLHQALVAYLSDVTTLAAALVPHGIPLGVEHRDGRRWDGVSLDHALWFHRPARADEWLLFVQSSPSAAAGRALTRADAFDRAGACVASLAQEGLLLVT